MCYHASNTKESAAELAAFFKIENSRMYASEGYATGYDIDGFTSPLMPVIIPENGERSLHMFTWGLVPHWVTPDKPYRANTLNARNDELFEKVSYRQYWENRCLVIVSGFFEPHDRKIAGKRGPASKLQKTESWYVRHISEPFLTFGGIYCNKTFAVITTDTSPMMSEVHNDGKRMPLILDNDELRDRWLFEKLTKQEMAIMMDSHPDDSTLVAYRTIDGIYNNRVDTNRPEANQPWKPSKNDPVEPLSLF